MQVFCRVSWQLISFLTLIVVLESNQYTFIWILLTIVCKFWWVLCYYTERKETMPMAGCIKKHHYSQQHHILSTNQTPSWPRWYSHPSTSTTKLNNSGHHSMISKAKEWFMIDGWLLASGRPLASGYSWILDASDVNHARTDLCSCLAPSRNVLSLPFFCRFFLISLRVTVGS